MFFGIDQFADSMYLVLDLVDKYPNDSSSLRYSVHAFTVVE
jgi:hypothetical protein